MHVLWFNFIFGFIFLKQVNFFQTGSFFSNQFIFSADLHYCDGLVGLSANPLKP